MKRHLGTLLLVLATLALGFLLLRERGAVTDRERAERKGRVFPSWRRDQVTRVTLRSDSGEVGLDRDPASNTWRLSGTTDEADPARADVLLDELEHAAALRVVEPAESLGLAPGRVRGELVMGPLTYRFALGAEAKQPAGAAYLRVEGEPPVVVERRLAAALLTPLGEYRDKGLVKVSGQELSELAFAPQGAAPFVLVRDGKLRFRLGAAGPYAARAPVLATLAALGELRAERFLGATEGESATRVPNLVLTLREGPGASTTLAFGGPCPGAPADVVVARRAQAGGRAAVHACVPAGIVATLTRAAGAYEDRQVFFARADEVEEITVRDASGTVLDLARKGGGFRQRAPEVRDLDDDAADAVTAWLRELLSVHGEPAPSDAPGAALAVVELHMGGVTESVQASRGAGAVLARRGDGRVIAGALESARLFSPPRATTRGLALVAGARARTLRGFELFCDGLSQRVVRKDGFRYASPEPFDLDPALAAGAANTLLNARAQRWISDARAPEHGLDSRCGARLSFEDDAGPGALTFELGARLGTGAVVGAIAGDSAVFEAPAGLAELVRRPLASRDLFGLDPARVRSVTVQRGLGVTHVGADTPLDAGAAPAFTLGAAIGALRPLFVARRGTLGADAGDDPIGVDAELWPADAGPRAPGRARYRLGREVTAPEGKVVYCEREGVPFVFAVRSELIEPFRAAVPRSR